MAENNLSDALKLPILYDLSYYKHSIQQELGKLATFTDNLIIVGQINNMPIEEDLNKVINYIRTIESLVYQYSQ